MALLVKTAASAAAALILVGCGPAPETPTPAPTPSGPSPSPPSMGSPFGRECEEFFTDSVGQRVNQKALAPPANLPVTIVDPLPSEVCRALESLGVAVPPEKCTYVHMRGFGSQCEPPAPPDSKHSYIKVTYSADCTELKNFADNATGPDVTGAFDWHTGVFKACEDKVVRKTVRCYEPLVPGEFPFFNNPTDTGYPAGFELRAGTGECALGANPLADSNCDPYFGESMNNGNSLVTIVDPDVPALFCSLGSLSAPCVFVHKVANHASGGGDTCISPTPPDRCHRYHIVKYTSECDLSAANSLVGSLQATDSLFDAAGVLKSCAGKVDGAPTMKCFAPVVPSDPDLPYDFPNYRVQECTCAEGLALVV